MAVAQLLNATRRYGAVTALDGVNLAVRQGEVLAAPGPNGAGKATAVRLLMGLARPSAGRARLLGHGPDVLLADIEMPGMSGLELAATVRDGHPRCKVIILTTFARPGYLRRALDAGVKGYLLKDAPSARLAESIRQVHRGGRAVDPELALGAWDEPDPLTDRERQVLRLAGEGKSGPEIARAVHLSEGTVRNYLSEAIGKLGASNRVEAARIARRKGWL